MAHATKSLPDSDDKIDAAAGDSRDMAMIVVTVDHVYLPLDEGENELLVAVSEDFGGWGVQARLAD